MICLKYQYRINSNFDACSYPGIQCKFYYDNTLSEQNGQQPKHKDYPGNILYDF